MIVCMYARCILTSLYHKSNMDSNVIYVNDVKSKSKYDVSHGPCKHFSSSSFFAMNHFLSTTSDD